MDSQEYRQEISDLAESLVDEMENHDRDSWLEYMHETIDGHSFCIYTAESQDVIRHSNNDGAAVDNFGADGIVQDGQLNWAMMAYCAIEQDVLEEIDRQGHDVNDDDSFGPRSVCDHCGKPFPENGGSLCDDCDGWGDSDDDNDDDGFCETCKGTGQVLGLNLHQPCPDCGGDA